MSLLKQLPRLGHYKSHVIDVGIKIWRAKNKMKDHTAFSFFLRVGFAVQVVSSCTGKFRTRIPMSQ